MELFCLGLSHQSAPLAVRERLALGEESQLELLSRLANGPVEALLLSTCNRVEFYVAAPSWNEVRENVGQLVTEMAGAEARALCYEHAGDRALVHLFRVAASLDSMVLGEAQILGQVKEAFDRAQRSGAAKAELTRMCSAAFASAKRVRTETGIGKAATSMASAAVELATKVFGGLEDKKVLLVGAGEMAELAAKHLKTAGVTELSVTNRTFERAQALADAVGGKAEPFDQLNALLIAADLIICSTASPTPLFTKERVAAAAKPRKHRPLFMVDLAVPRDIAPDVNALDGVYVYDVDDIQKVVMDNAAARVVEAAKAEEIISEEIARFVRTRALREGVPVLAQLRSRAEAIARVEVDRTLLQLGGVLNDKQKKSVEAMAMAIVNKLLHQPTRKLRALGEAETGNELIDAAARLFGLDASSDDPESGANESAPSAAPKPPKSAGGKS